MEDRETALTHLRVMTGIPAAEFREDQWEAIEAILKGERALVVQRTGWGKSAVYFIATAMIRERNRGVTMLISPLLSLIRNQMQSAKRLGLIAESINSAAPDDVPRVVRDIVAGKVDILLVAPERLADEKFQADVMNRIRIGLLVVDEAHCISDWGHDFRPDYRRIVRVVRGLPKTVPVLATTATANHRVVEDIREQLGEGLRILRGELTRKSIHLQTLHMKDQSERLAWLVQTIPRIEGTGIVYCLTKMDCTQVSGWLNQNGILSTPYFSGLGGENDDDRLRFRVEQGLLENRYKVVVATVALGMGFDKPDLSFVIHYQCPGSLIAYYQQVGRAGRALDRSYGILLHGKEDREIVDYFIAQAFPPAERLKDVLRVLGHSKSGKGRACGQSFSQELRDPHRAKKEMGLGAHGRRRMHGRGSCTLQVRRLRLGAHGEGGQVRRCPVSEGTRRSQRGPDSSSLRISASVRSRRGGSLTPPPETGSGVRGRPGEGARSSFRTHAPEGS